MPHSSGGGSHSGGSHSSSSSSHHSSGGGSSSGGAPIKSVPLVSYTPKEGYQKYAYYDSHGVSYKYVLSDHKQVALRYITPLLLLCVYIPFIIASICLFVQSFSMRHPLPKQSVGMQYYTEDRLGILTSDETIRLEKSLKAFYDKTGIKPAVITEDNESWQTYYNNLETYAYDLYVNEFGDDESCWLIVYSQPQNPDPEFNDWHFEGMQGNDTDPILTENVTSDFNSTLTKYLFDQSNSPGQALSLAFEHETDAIKVSGLTVDGGQFCLALLFAAFIGLHMTVMLRSQHLSLKEDLQTLKNAKETGFAVPEKSKEDTCEYCGGVYVHGVHINCPHCGATVKPL